MTEISEDTIKVVAEETCKQRMEEVCHLKHEKIVGDISLCISKKFTDFYKKAFWGGAVAVAVLLIGQIIIKEVWGK